MDVRERFPKHEMGLLRPFEPRRDPWDVHVIVEVGRQESPELLEIVGVDGLDVSPGHRLVLFDSQVSSTAPRGPRRARCRAAGTEEVLDAAPVLDDQAVGAAQHLERLDADRLAVAGMPMNGPSWVPVSCARRRSCHPPPITSWTSYLIVRECAPVHPEDHRRALDDPVGSLQGPRGRSRRPTCTSAHPRGRACRRLPAQYSATCALFAREIRIGVRAVGFRRRLSSSIPASSPAPVVAGGRQQRSTLAEPSAPRACRPRPATAGTAMTSIGCAVGGIPKRVPSGYR